MNLALHVIARDNVDDLRRIYQSYSKYFDEICFAIDSKEAYEQVKDIGARCFLYEWDEDEKRIGFPKFDKKRNFLAEKTNSEWYLRLDTDDYIQDVSVVESVFNKVKAYDIDCVFTKYIYSVDADGNCDAFQWRETIIKKNPNHYWKKSIHENILAENVSKFKSVKDSSLVIIHKADINHYKKSQERNLRFLLDEFQRDKENTDPRTLSYLGKTFMGLGEYKRAIPYFQMLIMKSGWDDDIYYSYISLAKCFFMTDALDDAVDACLQATKINHEYPDAYLQLCEIYIEKKDFKKAIHWGEVGIIKPQPQTMYVLSPVEYTYRAVMNLAMAYLGDGQIEKAKHFYDKASSIAPSNEFVKEQKSLFEEAYLTNEYAKALKRIVELTAGKSKEKLKILADSIPDAYLKDSHVTQIRNAIVPSKTWSDKSIVFFCGQAWEEWGPPSTVKGIGGSEEAVIYLAKEFVNLGYEVTVYNSCGDFMGEYEGVKYRPYYDLNQKDVFNIVICWRNNFFNQLSINAKQKYVWLHDVPAPDLILPDDLNTFDKVFVLSQFHKSLLPKYIPEEKIFVTANGINLPDFIKPDLSRNTKRLIHTSSYDRGIENLLHIWPEVKKEVPEAELHLFYGWETYDQMVKGGARSPEFKQKMLPLMAQEGVFEYGRIGHKKLVKEFFKSGIYVYPSHFEEISCISAMKAQACGCVPVVIDYAALSETVKEGVKIAGRGDNPATMEIFKRELIALLKDEARQEELRIKVRMNKESFGWDKVASQWSDLFAPKEVLA